MRRLAAISALVAALVVGVIATTASRGAGSPYQVTAIFDNAAFAVPGETVRISGANVGTIKSLDVCTSARPCPVASPLNKAAVTIEIDDARFTPFYANATCAIRPQSLIGERYVDCEPGSSNAPKLPRIVSGPGAGTYLLPLTRTSSPVDSDIVQNIYQEPIRERFALVLDELGTGLAARGSDLNAVIHRANPSLGYTDQVIKILARQNKQLAQLAIDSDTVLAPLARAKQELSGFVVGANTTSVASAARATDIARSFQLFPEFLRQLRPLMVDLGKLADQGTPLMAELGQSAAAVGRQFENLTPFAKAARPALIALGASSQQSQPALVASIPLAKVLENLGGALVPTASSLNRLTASLDQTGAIEQLMAVLFYGTAASNGFDSVGHYVRAEPLVGQCTAYVKTPVLGCSANFGNGSTASAAAASARGTAGATGNAPAPARGNASATASAAAHARESASATADRVVAQAVGASAPQPGTLKGLLGYLIGNGR